VVRLQPETKLKKRTHYSILQAAGAGAGLVIPLGPHPGTSLAQRYQWHASAGHPANFLAWLLHLGREFISMLCLTMPENAHRFLGPELWTASDRATVLRRCEAQHYDEIVSAGEVTLTCWDTWDPTIANIPYNPENWSTNLVWQSPLPVCTRSLDPNNVNNIIFMLHPAVTMEVITAVATPLAASRFDYPLPPVHIANGTSYARPQQPPLREYSAVFGAHHTYNYATAPHLQFPALLNVAVLPAHAAAATHGPPMHPALHAMLQSGAYAPWYKHRLLIGCIHNRIGVQSHGGIVPAAIPGKFDLPCN
jgi:hypothetical protein